MLLQILHLEGECTRQHAADCIADRGWFDITGEDFRPYPTQHEPRWRTLVAWARKDAFEHQLLADIGRDCWQLSADGRRVVSSLQEGFERRELDVRECYMWRPALKRFMCSSYEQSPLDAKRPPHIYEDQVPYDAYQQALWLLGELQAREQRRNV